MESITKFSLRQLVAVRLHILVVLSILVLALGGHMPDSEAGWVACPPQVVMMASRRKGPNRSQCLGHGHADEWWLYLSKTYPIPLLRSLLLWALWQLSGRVGPAWVRMVPWALWLWQVMGGRWPWLRLL